MAPPRALNPGNAHRITSSAVTPRSSAPTSMLPPKTSHVLQNSRAPAQMSLFQPHFGAR